MTQPEPIHRGELPATPPPEYEFYRWVDGDTLVAGVRPRINGHSVPVVRRLVTYGDWEPITPARWAEPEQARQDDPADPCRNGCRAAADELAQQGQEDDTVTRVLARIDRLAGSDVARTGPHAKGIRWALSMVRSELKRR